MPSGKASESRAFQSPSRYIQGPGEIRNLPKFAAQYGKTALAMMGMCREIFRLPLCEMEESNRERLRKVLADYDLL